MVERTKKTIKLIVNDEEYEIIVKNHWTLAFVLREKLGLTGLKVACGGGECGACTVIVDGKAIASCMTLAVECENKNIETIESLSKNLKNIHPLQTAWLEEYAAQCGFCSPGMILGAKALLEENPNPDVEEIKEALSGNLCICSNYDHIVKAVQRAAEIMDTKGVR
jgi:carbon-monoxide dehydrogenase small subunit